jgi:rare lipoprotein A
MSLKSQLGICLLAGAATGLAVAVVVPFSIAPVEADASLPRPASMTPPAPPALAATPIVPAPKKAAARPHNDFLRGIATWYGSVLDGHRTASGERFDMYAMTACHPTLPFGTLVRVEDMNTRKSVVVRINDRGVLSPGRIIDLSYAAARELNITKAGVAPVTLSVISMGGHHKN